MKTLKNPKGLELRPCLNCVATQLLSQLLLSDTELYKRCPCSNHTGEIQREIVEGKLCITQFSCENRIMHEAPVKTEKGSKNSLKAQIEARLAKIESEP